MVKQEQRIEMVSPSSDKEVQASPIQSVIDGLQQTSKGRLTYRRHGEHHLDLQHSHSASSHASPPTRLVLSEQTSLVASHLMPIGDQVLSDTEDEDDGDLETVKDDSDEETSLLPPDSAFHKEFLLYEEERRRRINDAICQKMLETEKELRALYESVEAQFLVQQQEILKAHQDNLRPLEHEQLIRWERVLKKQEELRASEAQQALEAESHLHREVERLDLGKRLGEASAAREILNEILKQHLSLLASKQVDESATRMRRIKVLMQDLENGSKDKDKVAAFKTELHGLQEWIGFIQNEVALALARAKQKEEDMKATNTVIPEAQTVSTAIKSPSLKKDSLVEGEIQSHTEEKQIHKEQKSSEEKEFGLKGYVSKESLKRWAMVQEKLTFAKRNSQELSTTPALKKFRFELQKAVNTPVNSISDVSREHLLDKFHKLHRLLKCETVETQGGKSISASRHPQGLMFCIEHLAAKFVRQGWEQVGSKPEAAFPLAAVIIALWHHHPQLGDLLLANFYEHCPYLLPYYVPKLQGQTDQEYYEALGYLYTNGQVEKQDKFLKRMAGITRLYAGLMVTPSQSGFHPFGINNAWTWLAEILQLDPRPDITATVLHEFLSVAGNALQMTYQRQFFKLIHVLCTEYLKRLVEVTPKGQGGPVTRLEHFLQQALRSQHFPPPEGMLPASFLII